MDTSRSIRIKKKTTNAQFDMLVRELSQLPKGKILNRAKFDAAWKKIALKVNSIGPPQRSVSEWKKVWSDLKRRTQLKNNEYETWESPEQSAWLCATKFNADFEQRFSANPPLSEEENIFELAQRSHAQNAAPSSPPPIQPEVSMQFETTPIKSEPDTTPSAVSMESENIHSHTIPPTPPADDPPKAGLLGLLLGISHAMTALVERQTAVAERQAVALERQAAATERQAAAIERQTFATERQAAATHAVLKLLSIQLDPNEKKD